MAIKEFHTRSNEHAGIQAGTKFKTIKVHHEVNGDVKVDFRVCYGRYAIGGWIKMH